MAAHTDHPSGQGVGALTVPAPGGAAIGPRRIAVLAAFALLILLPGRIALPPLDRDESRYLEATSQMIATGDIVDIRFQDRPRWLQPAGIYWLEAIAVRTVSALAGSDAPRHAAWPYRIPSLIAGVVNVLLTASIGTALFGAEAGTLAAVVLASSVLFDVEGRMATIDTVLLATVLVAERALLRLVQDGWTGRPSGRAPALLFWAALGCGLMLKGPVVLIPVGGALAALLLTGRTLDPWRRLRPATGIPLALAIVGPWCVAIGVVSHGAFFARAVGINMLGKVAGGQQAHGAPPGTYAAIFLASFWPGSLFALFAIPFAWARRRERAMRFALCLIVPHWVIYELIATKLPHYVLPTFPPIAIVTAASLCAAVPRPHGASVRALGIAFGAVWLLAGLAYAVAGPVLLWQLQGVVAPWPIAGATAGAVLIVAAALVLWRGGQRRAFVVAASAAVLLEVTLFGGVVPRLDTIWLAPRIAALVREARPCPNSALASVSFSEPSLVFLVGRDTKLLGPADAARFLARDRTCALALIGQREEAAFHAALAVPVRRLGAVDGINYSNGRRLELALWTANGAR